MLRLIALLALVMFAGPAQGQVTNTLLPLTPTLKRQVTVASELVRIGDLFENAGTVADIPIFRAPDLGETGRVPVSRVLQAIRPHDLALLDTRGLSEVVVTRASRAITGREIETSIARALAGQHGLGDAGHLRIIPDRDIRAIQVDPSELAELQVLRASYEPRSGRFDVAFDMQARTSSDRAALRFTGTVVETVDIVVLARPVARGEVLKSTDVIIDRRPKTEVTADVIGTVEPVIGFAARRPLPSGKLLRPNDLMKPELVQRNESTTIVYEVPGILLTMRGKALETGSEGDVVNVLNVQSKRTVQGTVTGPGRITVTGMVPRVVAAASPSNANATSLSQAE
jgi:flagella basal body P-ring formation protein FlgA